MQTDPLGELFPYQSFYVGMDNNPIRYIDPFGLNSVPAADLRKRNVDQDTSEPTTINHTQNHQREWYEDYEKRWSASNSPSGQKKDGYYRKVAHKVGVHGGSEKDFTNYYEGDWQYTWIWEEFAQGGGGLGTAILDGVQTGLDVVGLIPVVGEIADGVNALIYTGRGDYVNAGLSAAAMIPFAGWAATGGKLGNKALHYSKLADKAHGTASTFNKTTPIHSKILFNDITQGFQKQVIQTPKGPIIRADIGNGQFIQMRGFDRSGSHTTFDFINSNGLFYEFKFNR